MMKRLFLITYLLLLASATAMASHIVGGDFGYTFLGDTVAGGRVFHKYKVTLYIYQDCLTGVPDAINQDNPAFFTVYENNGSQVPVNVDTNIRYDPNNGGAITVPGNFSNDCINKAPQICLLRKRFEKIYYLPSSSSGYVVVYQRCCRNSSIINVISPGDQGATYSCTIPPTTIRNNSAVYKNYPPQIICLNNPLYYDHSASDADADSLSYEFCPAQVGATDADIKPVIAYPPPFDTVAYFPPFTYSNPISGLPVIAIDPQTGIITGSPNRIGRFLVTVCCNEWRNGVIINTIKREFQFVVTDCSKKVIADIPVYSNLPNTYIVNCADYTVHFTNTSSGGFSYKWTFDVEGNPGITSTEFEPNYSYPDTGTYVVKLVVNPGSTCPDSITRYVKIYPVFSVAFTDTGKYCPGKPITFTDNTTSTIRPILYWKWSFGDGTTSEEQNPVHTYKRGDTYNVILISENARNCTDTTLKRLVIQDFRPFAGNDTVIVKGEYIQFDAKGGNNYLWSPQLNLSDTTIYNPKANYPDTGYYTYMVLMKSNYGCVGVDTMNVLVVNDASHALPTAFTPNNDGTNDIFRPMAVGYRSIRFFKVYNRWGEEVYDGKSLEEGWDGTCNNKPAEMGVYFWQISYIDRFGKEGLWKGDVTLIR